MIKSRSKGKLQFLALSFSISLVSFIQRLNLKTFHPTPLTTNYPKRDSRIPHPQEKERDICNEKSYATRSKKKNRSELDSGERESEYIHTKPSQQEEKLDRDRRAAT